MINVQDTFRLCPKAFLNYVIKRSTVKNEAYQLDVEVPNISPARNNIYRFEKLCR